MSVLINPVVTIYKNPDSFSETVNEGKMGEPVEILEDENTQMFYKIKTLWDNYLGFVKKECVDISLDKWDPDSAVITSSLTNLVYKEPKVQSPVLHHLPLGIKLKLQNEELGGNWLKTKLPDGLIGYIQKGDVIYSEELKFSDIPSLRKSLVEWSSKFLNAVPYKWGGTSSFGIDCSGFVQHIYRLHDLPLERDASQQGQGIHLISIERPDILPGDLIFFTDYSHVGIAISHFSFIHATTYQRPVVQISQIDCPHWLKKTIQYSRYKF